MRAWHFFWTIAVVIIRLVLVFAGALVSMFGSLIVIVGIVNLSIAWLSAGAAIMLLGWWWLFERFPSRRTALYAKRDKGVRNE